jgi:hypothetical protein
VVLIQRKTTVLVSLALAAIVLLGASPALAGPCAAAWSCNTSYAQNAQASFNGNNYTLTAGARGASCPGYDPSADNWWTNNGACTSGGATPTYTPTATNTPTPTNTTRPGSTPTNTPTPTSTHTPTPSGGGGSCSGVATWVPGTVDPNNGNRFQYCSPARLFEAKNNPGSWETPPCPGSGGNWFWNDLGLCGGGGGGPTPTSTNTPTPTPTSGGGGSGIGSIVSASQFDQIWPPGSRAATYTYNDFVTAADTYYPALCNTGDTNVRKRECAAYFANKDQETGMGQYDRELYCQPGGGGYGSAACNYCDSGNAPCGACAGGQQYWGRHSIQLSWNYNYCNGGNSLSPTVNLHANPNEIFTNKVTGWRLANWYWMTQLGPNVSNGYGTWPQQSAHTAITATHSSNNYGFGGTIRAINGSIECGSRIQQQLNRVTYYNGSGGDEEDGSGGVLGILGYSGGTFGRRFCSP